MNSTQKNYSPIIQKLGGRKAVAIWLLSLLAFVSVLLSFLLVFVGKESTEAWSFVKFYTPWFAGAVIAWAKINYDQKKMQMKNGNNEK